MEKVLGEIPLYFTDPEINSELLSLNGSNGGYTRHFNQNEEFFLRVTRPVSVPSIPIHHDVRKKKPEAEYLTLLRDLVRRLGSIIPEVFSGLTYFFDPGEVLRPCFFRLYRIGDATYLYLIKIDLTYRPTLHTVEEKGSNDVTPRYSTNDIVLEADVIPLQHVVAENGRTQAFKIAQSIDQTWIGETGRGYFVQGIWLDSELTKFFSRLFYPEGKRMYPYYPFTCKYRAICHTVIDPTDAGRKAALPLLHRARRFLDSHIKEIQDSLRANEFSTDLEVFKRLKSTVPAGWADAWENVTITVDLNDRDMKEFTVV